MQWHNKANSVVGPDGHRRLAVYSADSLRVPGTLAGEVYATQFVQAEAMRHAYEAFRSRWQHAGARACGGALVWQLNDCWPVTSWALVDSGGHVKPAWFAVRRALAPLACALRRDAAGLAAWVMNAVPVALALTARWRLWALDGRLLHDEVTEVTAMANGSNVIAVPAALAGSDAALVVSLQLQAADGQMAAATAWPEPYRWYRFPDPRIACKVEGATRLVLSAAVPAKGVWLQARGARFADNFVDLLPGETMRLAFDGAHDGLAIRCLNTLQDPPAQAALQ